MDTFSAGLCSSTNCYCKTMFAMRKPEEGVNTWADVYEDVRLTGPKCPEETLWHRLTQIGDELQSLGDRGHQLTSLMDKAVDEWLESKQSVA